MSLTPFPVQTAHDIPDAFAGMDIERVKEFSVYS